MTAIEPMTFDHAGVSVASIDAARQFYGDVLGFTESGKIHELTDLGIRIQILVNSSGLRIELFEHVQSAPSPARAGHPSEDARMHGWFQLGLRVTDIKATWDRVTAAGARPVMSPRLAPDDKTWMAFIADPDNNLVEFIQRQPA